MPNFPLTYNGYDESLTAAGYEVAIIGHPHDAGSTGKGGQREGPQAIRSAAFWPHNEIYDPVSRHRLKLSVCDLGDTDAQATIEDTGQGLTDYVHLTRSMGATPVVLGGDDSLTYFCLAGVRRTPDHDVLAVLHFDAHSDLWEADNGYLDHGSWVAKSLDEGLASSVHLYGHRCFGPVKKTWRKYAKKGHHETSALSGIGDVIEQSLRALSDPLQPIWLAIDLDVFDPAFAPGVAAQEPGGLLPLELLPAFQVICMSRNVVGVSVTELLPARDPSGVTATLASHVVMQCLLGLSQRKANASPVAAVP